MLSYTIGALIAATALAGSGKDYDYIQNGADWGTILEGKYSLCDTGLEQSPIDLTSGTVSDNIAIDLEDYYNFRTRISTEDVAYTTNFELEWRRLRAQLTLTFDDESEEVFTPRQFHFHAPSEHSVDGSLYDAEVHFVHVF